MSNFVIIFSNNNREYVCTDGAQHKFELLSDDALQRAEQFPDKQFAESYPDAMIDRGLWNDTGIYQHRWKLIDDKLTVYAVTTTDFLAWLGSKSSRFNMENVRTDDPCGFLNRDNYTIKEVVVNFK